MNHARFWTLTALVLAAVAIRLAPHPPNVTPLLAIALFGGATFAGRGAAVFVPLAALLASDAAMHLAYRAGWLATPGFYPGQWVVYACFLAAVGIGFLVRRRRTLALAAAGSLACSVIFFLATNLVWPYGPHSLYPQTLAGQLTSYQMALPFFRNSLAGDLAYTLLLFGALALAEARFPALRAPEAGAVGPKPRPAPI